MADFAFNGYSHEVLENEVESSLSTALDINRFMTRDETLMANDGEIVKLHRYKGTGSAQHLDRGESNDQFIDAQYTEQLYKVKRSQATTRWYDSDLYSDSVYVSTKVKALSDSIINLWTADAIAEFAKTENLAVMSNYDLGEFADAIAKYTNKHETQEGLFFLCDVALIPKIRKMLGANLMYSQDYITKGAVFGILGVPVYTSKAVSKDMIYLADQKAVRAWIKADTTIETSRNIQSKENVVVATKNAVIALVDEDRCIACGQTPATATTISTYTKNQKTVAGAATTGATVTAYVNGEATGSSVTASSSSYSITATNNLVAGDVVKVVAELNGYLKSIATVTVAE